MRLIIFVLVFLFLGVTAWAQKVEVEYNKAIDFSKIKTYNWTKGTPAKNAQVDQWIIKAVDRELAARGLVRQESGGDIQVLYMAAVGFDLQVPRPSWSSAGGSSASTGIATIGQAWDIQKGTLLLHLMDQENNTIWHGSAVKTLSDAPQVALAKDAKKVERIVNDAVSKMFKKYPVGKPS